MLFQVVFLPGLLFPFHCLLSARGAVASYTKAHVRHGLQNYSSMFVPSTFTVLTVLESRNYLITPWGFLREKYNIQEQESHTEKYLIFVTLGL